MMRNALRRRLARAWAIVGRRWYVALCLHDWTHTYGRDGGPRWRICRQCRCVSVRRRGLWWALRRRDGSLVFWWGDHGPSGDPLAGRGRSIDDHSSRREAWGHVNRNATKVAAALGGMS